MIQNAKRLLRKTTLSKSIVRIVIGQFKKSKLKSRKNCLKFNLYTVKNFSNIITENKILAIVIILHSSCKGPHGEMIKYQIEVCEIKLKTDSIFDRMVKMAFKKIL
jgi:hypothetical protein